MSLFVHSSRFNNPFVTPKTFCALVGAILLQCCTICRLNRARTGIDRVTFFFILFSIYLFIHAIFADTGVLPSLIIICILLLYLGFKSCKPKVYEILNTIIISAATLQAILGILQYWGITGPDSGIGISGSFDNPAGFAIGLAISCPFTLPLLRSKQMRRKAIGYLMLTIITLAIFHSKSRTGLLATGVIWGYIFWIECIRKSYTRKAILFLFCSIFLGVAIHLFIQKKDSASGRLLIWQVSTTQILGKNIILGNGTDSFLAAYMPAQGRYIRNHPADSRLLLADNVIHPFNEYLLILIEYGVVGLLLLFLIIYSAIHANIRQISPYLLSLLSLLLCSFFSYPFRYAYVWLITAYSLANLSAKSPILIVIRLPHKKLIRPAFLMFNGLGLLICISEIKKETDWNQSFRLAAWGSQEWISRYEHLYPQQHRNPFFLYNYAALLNRNKNFRRSILILHECEKRYNDYDVQMLFADNYYNLKRFDLAERYYENAADMIPSRIMPDYCLWKMYISLDNKEKTLQSANSILSKKIKIENPISEKIKAEVQKYISDTYGD